MSLRTSKNEPRTHLGAYALCLDSQNRLLLCRMSTGCSDEGHWTLPGGGIEWGEPPAAAVARELQEETGLKARDVDLAENIFSEVYSPAEARFRDPVHHVGILYRVHGVAGRLRPEIAGTTDRCVWFSREEAEQLPLTALGRFGLGVAWAEYPGSDPNS